MYKEKEEEGEEEEEERKWSRKVEHHDHGFPSIHSGGGEPAALPHLQAAL